MAAHIKKKDWAGAHNYSLWGRQGQAQTEHAWAWVRLG